MDFKNFLNKLTIKFNTTDGKVFIESIPASFNIGQIKKHLSKKLNFPENLMDLTFDQVNITNETPLEKFQPDNYGILAFELISKDTNSKIPALLIVKVQKPSGFENVTVEIENKPIPKPFLGGFKNTIGGTEYHHGYSQTGPLIKKPATEKFHRDTQTYFKRNRRINTDCSKSTLIPTTKDRFQLTKEIFIPSLCDKLLTPGPYETPEERSKRLSVEEKVKLIQRSFRAWKTRKQVKILSEEFRKRVRIEKERDEKELQENQERKRKDLASKVFPLRSDDFGMLFSMVKRWKEAELERIATVSCGAAKNAEYVLLFDKEMEILQSLDRLKSEIKEDLKIKKINDFFKAIGKPIEWDSDYKHIHIIMDTLETQKGREYFNLYKDLRRKHSSKDDLIEMYTKIKDYLKTHQCTEGREIVSLIDRLFELMKINLPDKFLGALRKRIRTLVLHHFELQECNQGVTNRMQKLTIEHSTKHLIYCESCQMLKPLEAFSMHARLEKIKTCVTCKRLNKAEEPWIDLSPYKFMIKHIRNYERLHEKISSVAFIVQEIDLHLIVNTIWNCRSAISECRDIDQLLLVRWKKDRDWAPWNCILLTLEETRAHLRIANVEEFYEDQFINHVFNKHALARHYFKDLKSYDRHFADLGKDDPKLNDYSDFYVKEPEYKRDVDRGTQMSDLMIEEETTDGMIEPRIEHNGFEVIFKKIYTSSDDYDDDYD